MTVRAGTVGLVGRPNAGKSTLLNRLLGQKIAIVSDKPQTTRHQIVGILSEERGQMVLVDTPGVHKPRHRMNRRMVKAAVDALGDVDVLCLLVDASVGFGRGDEYMLGLLERGEVPRVLLLNKVDRVRKAALLPLMERYSEGGMFEHIIPISALDGDGVGALVDLLWESLPEGPPIYDPGLVTVHPERYLAAERIREKVLASTREELPFSTAVLVVSWEDEERLVRIGATVLVERSSQRGILIGAQGAMIKKIGSAARVDLEELLGRRVYLDLHVRCEPGWREKIHVLEALDRDLHAGALRADVDPGVPEAPGSDALRDE